MPYEAGAPSQRARDAARDDELVSLLAYLDYLTLKLNALRAAVGIGMPLIPSYDEFRVLLRAGMRPK